MTRFFTGTMISVTTALALGLSGTTIAAAATRQVAGFTPTASTLRMLQSPAAPRVAHFIRVATEPSEPSSQVPMSRFRKQQLALNRREIAELGTIRHELTDLVKIERDRVAPGATAAPLSLAGCRDGKSMFPKGAEVNFSPDRMEVCTDAVAGKPTYGLAWHLMPASQPK